MTLILVPRCFSTFIQIKLVYWLLFYVIIQIGPNVSISANARIGAGSRLISCIILDDVEIKVWIYRYAEDSDSDLKFICYYFFLSFVRIMQLSYMQLLDGNRQLVDGLVYR